MTSDMGEMFNELKKERQAKRADNRAKSLNILQQRGIPVQVNNNGAHLIVGKPVVCDFWPGTGKWIYRMGGFQGYGVRKLLNSLQQTHSHLFPAGSIPIERMCYKCQSDACAEQQTCLHPKEL